MTLLDNHLSKRCLTGGSFAVTGIVIIVILVLTHLLSLEMRLILRHHLHKNIEELISN